MRLLPSRIVYWLLVFMLGRLPSSYTVALRRISNVKKTIPFSSVSATESGLSANRERNQLRILNLKLSEKRSFPAKPAPAKVPRTMEDHAKVALPTNSNFPALGLCTDLVAALDAQGIQQPTPVQKAVIPRILKGENLLMAASTGSGKTLAYMLPCMQELRMEEEQGYVRRPKRPRCIVLVPTRELARQVLHSVKQIGHYSKVASTAVLGGEQYGEQTKELDRMVDVVVASPGRLMQHKQQGNVYFSHVRHVIIDEVDTMLMEGFGSDIRAILRSVMARHSKEAPTLTLSHAPLSQLASKVAKGADVADKKAQVIMATATLTKAVKSLLTDVQGGFNIEYSDPSNATPRQAQETDQLLKINIVEVDGVHRSLPNVTHVFEEAHKEDKLVVLRDVLARHRNKQLRTLIFCNTVASCRAVEYAINQDTVVGGSFSGSQADGSEHQIRATSYHGDLNSHEREHNLARFRNGTEQYMVCTDIAARGLDIPEIAHIVMFDFPLNPIDYLHRAGRCGRAGRKGLVTSLVAKRDVVLAGAIEEAISKGLAIDALTSDKKDYTGKGKMVKMLKVPRSDDEQRHQQDDSRRPRSRSFPDRRGADSRSASGVATGSRAGFLGRRDSGKTEGGAPAGRDHRRGRSPERSFTPRGSSAARGRDGPPIRSRSASNGGSGFRGRSRASSPARSGGGGSGNYAPRSPARAEGSVPPSAGRTYSSDRTGKDSGMRKESPSGERRRSSSPADGDRRSSGSWQGRSSGSGNSSGRSAGPRGGSRSSSAGPSRSRSASFAGTRRK